MNGNGLAGTGDPVDRNQERNVQRLKAVGQIGAVERRAFTVRDVARDLEVVEAVVVKEAACKRGKIQRGNGEMHRCCRRENDEKAGVEAFQRGDVNSSCEYFPLE